MRDAALAAEALDTGKIRVLFVNSGILGVGAFDRFIREAMALEPGIAPTNINLLDGMTFGERLVRRAFCARFWPDGLMGLRNLDLARFRHEYHAGFQAGRRMRRMGARPFDVLHFHRQATAYGNVALMSRTPSIVSIDCTQQVVLQSSTSALERVTYQPNVAMEGRVFTAAAAIVATSRWAARSVAHSYPDCPTPVHVMPPPVRMQFFDERWIDERRARAAAGARPRVLFMGGDFPRKGGYDLLEAWCEGGFHRHADLDVVTNWPVNPHQVPEGATLVRRVSSYSPEWVDIWRRADIFIMPTLDEAFGMVFQEAAAAGLPRIGTRLNAIPEIVREGETGYLVSPGDCAGIIEALVDLIASPGRRAEFGRLARRRLLEDASPDGYTQRLSSLIQSLVPGRSLPLSRSA